MLDLCIRGGLVVNGTGAPGRRADVGIADGRVADVAAKLSDSARETIDTTDLVVAPGFIDSHTHLDGQLFWDKEGTSSSWHGCTTVIQGNCGFTLAPIPDGPEYPLSLMAGVEQIPRPLLKRNVPWTWRTFAEFTRSLEAGGIPLNVASYVGYPLIRHAAMGEAALTEVPTDDERAAIDRLLREALDAGALGISFNRQAADRDDKGRWTAGYDCGWGRDACPRSTCSPTIPARSSRRSRTSCCSSTV